MRGMFVIVAVLAVALTACGNGAVDATRTTPTAVPAPVTPAVATDVTTWHNDAARSGLNRTESVLTPANVNVAHFGKLRSFAVDGKVDAQPLYLSGYNFADGRHNALFVATEHDTVYAFDADSGHVLWKQSLLGAGETLPTAADAFGCSQVEPALGITSTPVIDRERGLIYVVAMSKDNQGGYHQRLHALKLTDGSESAPSPVEITAQYLGDGAGSRDGRLTFDPQRYKERSALLLDHGRLILSWASHCDVRPYTGWVMAYDAGTLDQLAVLNITPNGSDGAFWNAGSGPAADDDGEVYLMAGNGTFDTTLNAKGFPDKADFGNAFLKLVYAKGALSVADYFTMHDTVAESAADDDLGSGGLLLLPAQRDSAGHLRHLLVGAGKDKRLYVLDRDDMGHFDPKQDHSDQQIEGALSGPVFSAPAYFNGMLYYAAVGDQLKAFRFDQARLQGTPASRSAVRFAYPGATPSVSANGSDDGIVWVVQNDGGDAVLRAYDAGDLSKQLWSSDQAADQADAVGSDNKYMVPTIADGRVFVGTTDSVAEFGLLAQR